MKCILLLCVILAITDAGAVLCMAFLPCLICQLGLWVIMAATSRTRFAIGHFLSRQEWWIFSPGPLQCFSPPLL
jgi:hypothetical protein